MTSLKKNISMHKSQMYKQWSQQIRGMVHGKLARYPHDHRQDVVQDVWADVLEEVQRGEVITDRRVITLVERHVKRCKRAHKRWQLTNNPLQREEGVSLIDIKVPDTSNPERIYVAKGLCKEAHRKFAGCLTKTQQQVITARAVWGKSVSESAEHLGLSRDVVVNELRRGLGRLRNRTEEGTDSMGVHSEVLALGQEIFLSQLRA